MEILTASKNSDTSDIPQTDILNALPALISHVNSDMRYTYVNDAFLKLHHTTREAVIGHTVQEVLGDNLYKYIDKHIIKALHGEKTSFDIPLITEDGEHYFQGIYTPEIDSEGQVKGYTAFVVQSPCNTDELLKKNEDLKRSEERYHKMVEEVQDYAIILLDVDGNILDWNKGAEQIKGYKHNEILGQNFRLFYLPEDRSKMLPEQLLKEAAENGRAEHEGWRVRKDGTKFLGTVVITALHNDEGKIIGYTKVTKDLTNRKLAEEQQLRIVNELQQKNEDLRRSEERYHKLVSEVEDYAIILLDRSGYIQNWNKGAEKIKGYKAEEIVGKNFRLFYSAEDRENKLPERLLQTAVEKGKAEHEGWRVKKDGSKFWGAIVITALHDSDKNIIGFSKVTRDLTERKAAEEKQQRFALELQQKNEQLKKNEERYHKMIAEVEDYAIILLDKKGNIVNWNKGAERIKGYKAEEIIGKNFRIFYSTEDRESKLPDSLLHKAEVNGKANHEGWRVKKDGAKFWGSIVITAIHDSENNVIGFSKVTRDLTKRKAAEEKQQRYAIELEYKNEELRRSEERYHKMISEIEDYAIILLDPDGHIQNWNKGAEKIKGYKTEEIIGKHFSIFYLPEDQAKKLPAFLLEKARKEGKSAHEGWRVKKDGTKFWGSIVLTALHDTNNNIIGFSKVTRDLTERKIAEEKQHQFTVELQYKNEQLRRSEERYHKMISEVEDYAIILLDPEGNIQNWNKGAERIKGYKTEEIIGKSFKTFYSKEDIQNKLPDQLLRIAIENGSSHHEGWRIRKDGTKFWGSVVMTALHDSDGNIIGVSKVTRDLTERKIAEDKQKQNAEQLEAQNKELEQFAYVASHDLQEPLRKIRTFNSLIIEHEGENLSEKAKDYFNRSISAADRMNRLIEDLLAYSRATRDLHKIENVDLNLVVARVKANYKESEKKIIIETDHLPELPGMQFQFEQLFDNLIGNGIKYQKPGNIPHIKIRYKVVGGNEIKGKDLGASLKYHQICVIDNGIGFDEAFSEKIFEMFQRLHGRSEYSGSGIGLAIVKKIVTNYNGFITAESKPGDGSTFCVYFPLK